MKLSRLAKELAGDVNIKRKTRGLLPRAVSFLLLLFSVDVLQFNQNLISPFSPLKKILVILDSVRRHHKLRQPSKCSNFSRLNCQVSMICMCYQWPVSGVHKSFSSQIRAGIVGYPNVGKSSLINRLLKRRMCPAAPRPGVTRELKYVLLLLYQKHNMN